MIDCHFHLWTEDTSTAEKRAERADQARTVAEELGVERICLIHERGETVEECRANNQIVGAYVDEHPDLFFGWARANPLWGEDGVAEFRRAVEEDGLIGLKLYAQAFLDDPEVEPLAEAAVDLDVPIISHVGHRHDSTERHPRKPKESNSDNVRALAESFPDLTLISGHIGGGGVWEYRIKNIAHLDNVYLDTSGSVVDSGQLEMAVEYLGADRLVYGTDTWFLEGFGKLRGSELDPAVKAEIGYNMGELIHDRVPNALSEDALAAGIKRATAYFEQHSEPRSETIIDTHLYVGNFPWRRLDASPYAVTAEMDRVGIDSGIVSSLDAVFYRNPHEGNKELAAAIDGYEDRFIPFATLDPTYPRVQADLDESIDELGMQGVRLYPLYHNYDLEDPRVVELLESCADREVPVMFVAHVEDKRQTHANWRIRDYEEAGSKSWASKHTSGLINLLQAAPETDVIIANITPRAAARVRRAVTTSYAQGVRLQNKVRTGDLYFVIDDMAMFWPHQGEQIRDEIGVEHLVNGSKVPIYNFDGHHIYTDALPVADQDRAQIRSGNIEALLGDKPPERDQH